MTAEQLVEYCYWYLSHVHLFLIPAALFDIICWIAIGIFVYKRRRKNEVQSRTESQVQSP